MSMSAQVDYLVEIKREYNVELGFFLFYWPHFHLGDSMASQDWWSEAKNFLFPAKLLFILRPV
jgi:hypothetical protein